MASEIERSVMDFAGSVNSLSGTEEMYKRHGLKGILPGLVMDTQTQSGGKRDMEQLARTVGLLSGFGIPERTRLMPVDQYARLGGVPLPPGVSWTSGVTSPQRTQQPTGLFGERSGVIDLSTPVAPRRPLRFRPDTPSTTGPMNLPPRRPGEATQGGGIIGVDSPQPEGMVWTEEILTPESSHIYSIQYNKKEKVLYVSFKGPGTDFYVNSSIPSVCKGELHRWGFRPFTKGVTYAYGSQSRPVPQSVWDGFVSADSKGRFLWQNIRGCDPSSPIYPEEIRSPVIGNHYFTEITSLDELS